MHSSIFLEQWYLLLGFVRPSISSLLQSATSVILKCDGLLLQSVTAFITKCDLRVMTKCDRYYKVQQFYYKVWQVSQSAAGLMLLLNKLLFEDRNNFLHGRAFVWLDLGTGSHQFFKLWISYLLNLLRQLATIWSITYCQF